MTYYKCAGHTFTKLENAMQWSKLGNARITEVKTYNPITIVWVYFTSTDRLLENIR